jgi:ABC-2 type transport system ATP-binding protein
MPSGSDAVTVCGLAKRYRDGTDAVLGVTFSVKPGEIVGLVGPNGAGKSTVLNMLATLITPTGGEAHICGASVRDRKAVRRLLGVALQATGLDPLMTVSGHFAVHAALYNLPSAVARGRTRELLDAFDLGRFRDRRAGELSGGTQRRLSLGLALLHGPRAIVFDEPTVGLDPSSRRGVWELLEDLRCEGLAVLFSTHYMDEADRLCQRIELMSRGVIVASGSPEELKAQLGTGVLRLRVRAETDTVRQILRSADALDLARGTQFEVQDDTVAIRGELSALPVDALISWLHDRGVTVVELRWGHGTLDDVFTDMVDPGSADEGGARVAVEHGVVARRGARR